MFFHKKIFGFKTSVENGDKLEDMSHAYENLRGMYDENDDNTQVLYIQNATATFSSFTAPEEVIKF